MKKGVKLNIKEFIENLTKEDLELLYQEFEKKKSPIPTFTFSKIKIEDLKKIFKIKRVLNNRVFESWFENSLTISKEEELFLTNLLDRVGDFLSIYKEEDLKVKFISPILNRINFLLKEYEIRDFYNEKFTYETEKFKLTGEADFVIANGLETAETPYFFLQEFKRAEDFSNPRPQLLAELISAVELNGEEIIRGVYVIGTTWNFVILERLEKHNYRYFVSREFNSTNREDLKQIYKNLLFIKDEIIKKVEGGRWKVEESLVASR